MKPGWAAAWPIGFSIVFSLLVAGIILLVSNRPRGEPIRLLPPPTPLPLVVQVGGAVAQPGLYNLLPGSRVIDAIQAAGGLLPSANTEIINQAAFIQDGDLVWIPFNATESEQLPATPSTQPDIPPDGSTTVIPSFPINLNTATAEELEVLPGIGPELARRIVEYRTTYGPFPAIEDIQSVDGIAIGKFERIKDLITVDITPPGSAPQ